MSEKEKGGDNVIKFTGEFAKQTSVDEILEKRASTMGDPPGTTSVRLPLYGQLEIAKNQLLFSMVPSSTLDLLVLKQWSAWVEKAHLQLEAVGVRHEVLERKNPAWNPLSPDKVPRKIPDGLRVYLPSIPVPRSATK